MKTISYFSSHLTQVVDFTKNKKKQKKNFFDYIKIVDSNTDLK